MFNTGIGGFKVPFTIPKGKTTTAAKKPAAKLEPWTGYPGISRAMTPAEQKHFYPQGRATNTPYLEPISRPGGGGGSTGTFAAPYDAAAAAQAAQKAADDARMGKLKGQGNMTLDQLAALYDELMGLARTTAADQTTRINKNYDGKVNDQIDQMHEGQYAVDAGAAASNLADSSFRSFDRGKVRKAADSNIKTINDTRGNDLGELGKNLNTEVASYEADKNGIGLTRQLLNESTDLSEITGTVTKLDSTKRGAEANRGKYGTQGSFVQSANKLGNYDTTQLEATLTSVISNASASPAAKRATVNDLLDGTGLDDKKKNELKSKYTQTIG